jgi:hypothetical protein
MTQVSIEDYLAVARFEGPPDNAQDFDRLCGQLRDIYNLMSDHRWRTLQEIEDITGHPQASISAQLRHLRKHRFGGHQIDKQRRVERWGAAKWEYRMVK